MAAIVVIAGAIVFRWAILRRWTHLSPSAPKQWSAVVAAAGAWGATSLLLVAPARLYEQARTLVDAGEPVAPMMTSVLGTLWGRGWLLQVIGAATALLGCLLARRGWNAGWWIALASSLALTASPAFMGHAAAAEQYVAISLLADWVHVSAAGAWVGTLAMLALAARITDPGDAAGATTATLIELFHPVALISAAALLLTGVASVLLRVTRIGDLLHSDYGAILAVKVVLTMAVAAVGWHHSKRGALLARTRGSRAVLGSLATETMFAVAVIATTAVLVGTSPPMPEMDMSCAPGESSCAHLSPLDSTHEHRRMMP